MSNFKSSFVSTMSDERRKEIAKQVSAAVRVGDMELAGKLAFQIPLSLPRARVLKADWGIERRSARSSTMYSMKCPFFSAKPLRMAT